MDSYQQIADRLIKDGYLLTALELYTELSERGKSLKSLKEFFEDPTNFEQFQKATNPSPSPSISSLAGSHQTWEDGSFFDPSRFSEDSQMHPTSDKVAILEFELRKCRQTIDSLRTELTQQANIRKVDVPIMRGGRGSISSADENDNDDDDEEESLELLGHEKRTLNYLVNEYLLRYGFKLTSITFSDENSNEDFEDWESIGLNVAKPPDLGRIYRKYNAGSKKVEVICTKCSVQSRNEECQADILTLETYEEVTNECSKKGIEIEELERLLQVEKEAVETLKSEKDELVNGPPKEPTSLVVLPEVVNAPSKMVEQEKPGALAEYLSVLFHKSNPDVWNDYVQTDMINEENFEDVIVLIGKTLPEIIPHVLLSQRGNLLPLLLTAIEHHKDQGVRDELLSLLFNLTKKPDEETRVIIARGFKEIARRQILRNDKDYIEREVLPQLWQQIEHKYSERGILVGSTCTYLMPLIPNGIRDSLVFSMLHQLIGQDRDLKVRETACDSLAYLCLYLKDEEKLNHVLPCTIFSLVESEEELRERVQNKLLLSVATFCSMEALSNLTEKCLNNYLTALRAEEWSNSVSQFKTIQNLLPFVIFSVIKVSPIFESISDSEPANRDDHGILNLLLIQERKDPQLVIKKFKEMCSKEWFERWPRLKWFEESVMDVAIRSTSLMKSGKDIVISFISFFHELCGVFGSIYIKNALSRYIDQKCPLLLDSSILEGEDVGDKSQYESAIPAIYFFSVMMPLNREKCNKLAEILRKWSIMFSLYSLPTEMLIWTQKQFLKTDRSSFNLPEPFSMMPKFSSNVEKWKSDVRDSMCEMAWNLVVNPSLTVKCFAGQILNVLASSDFSGNDDLIATKILPGLVTLASDGDLAVQKSAVAGLGSVICAGIGESSAGYYSVGMGSRITNETREKACFQLISPLNNLEDDVKIRNQHENFIAISSTIGNVIRQISDSSGSLEFMTLRDGVMFPKLAVINNLYQPATFNESKCLEMANLLLSVYKSILTDFSNRIPQQVFKLHVHPSLCKVASDYHRMGIVAQETSTLQLLQHVEKEFGISGQSFLRQGSMGASQSMDDMKQKVGKIFSGPSFWKK